MSVSNRSKSGARLVPITKSVRVTDIIEAPGCSEQSLLAALRRLTSRIVASARGEEPARLASSRSRFVIGLEQVAGIVG